MQRWIDKLSDEDRRVYLTWARGALATYGILVVTLVCCLVAGPAIATWVAHAVNADLVGDHTASIGSAEAAGRPAEAAPSLVTPTQVGVDRYEAAQREFRRLAASR